MLNNDIPNFHTDFYLSNIWSRTRWLGVNAHKCPFDIWVYQEIVYEHRPDVIIECGTGDGGTALFLANICELIGMGRVISIDINSNDKRPQHELIDYIIGSSTFDGTIIQVKELVKKTDGVMAILDSDHRRDYVRRELDIYSKLVTEGQYLIVEDTNLNGNPVKREWGPGPMEAVKDFMAGNNEFVIDKRREKYLMTFNPNGYLLKVRDINE